jgi:hypothetical protein
MRHTLVCREGGLGLGLVKDRVRRPGGRGKHGKTATHALSGGFVCVEWGGVRGHVLVAVCVCVGSHWSFPLVAARHAGLSSVCGMNGGAGATSPEGGARRGYGFPTP